MARSILRYAVHRLQEALPKRVKSFHRCTALVGGKHGLEIGGPSRVYKDWNGPLPIYKHVGSLDNCDFSQSTTWMEHANEFKFVEGKAPGKNIFCDGTDLAPVSDSSYEFVLSSHNLEHIANPVRALKEWQRVTKPGGTLLLFLPHYANTFDHQRTPTPVSHMLEDFENGTQEDDLTHLPEILEKHDLRKDSGVSTVEEFHKRSLQNFTNRCLHQHVFDEKNSRELLTRSGFIVEAVERAFPFHIFLLARMPEQ